MSQVRISKDNLKQKSSRYNLSTLTILFFRSKLVEIGLLSRGSWAPGWPNALCDVINRIISTDGDWRYPFLLCWTMRIAENHVIVQCFIFLIPRIYQWYPLESELCEEQKQEMVAAKQNYQTSIFWFWHYHVDQSLPDIILDTLWLQCLLYILIVHILHICTSVIYIFGCESSPISRNVPLS